MTPEALNTLITTYTAAWSEPDPQARMALLEQAWDADGIYTDPTAHAPGREALHALIGGFLAANPGATFALTAPIDHHHEHIRFYWALRFANGQELAGMDYAAVSPEGKLAKIVGFF